MAKLSDAELQDVLADQPEWSFSGGALVRDWEFKDFAEAMGFVNQVAGLAEEADHHPDIDIRYNKVHLALVSHDAGGITKRDVSLAKRISSEI